MHFTKCFKQWCDDHWAHCIKSQGAYFEVDSVDYNFSGVVMGELMQNGHYFITIFVNFLIIFL